MFEPELLRKQIHCIEESTCDIFGIFRRLGNCAPLVTPLTIPKQPLQIAKGMQRSFDSQDLMHDGVHMSSSTVRCRLLEAGRKAKKLLKMSFLL